MIVDEIRRCYSLRLDGKYEWRVNVWVQKGMFSSFAVTSTRFFKTLEEAKKDCQQTLSVLRLQQKGRASVPGLSSEQPPTEKSELARVGLGRHRNKRRSRSPDTCH